MRLAEPDEPPPRGDALVDALPEFDEGAMPDPFANVPDGLEG